MPLIRALRSAPLGALFVLAACSSSSNSGNSSSASVSAIAVSPNPCAVGHTDSIQMQALATLADGTKKDITKDSATTWSSGDTNTATVSSSGTVVGVNAGVTSITASYEGASGKVDCAVGP